MVFFLSTYTAYVNGMKDEGYIYRNMITNIYYLLPLLSIIYTDMKKKRKPVLLPYLLLFYKLYSDSVFCHAKGVISTYFFTNYILSYGLFCGYCFYKGAVALEENRKSGNKIVILYMSIYVILLMISLFKAM